jgi:hypothetical protein
MMPPWSFSLLLLTAVMNHVSFCWAFYLRAHKQEPFLSLSVVLAICICLSTVLLGWLVGANAVVIGYFIFSAVLGLPWAAHLFVSKRREWHDASVNGNPVNEIGAESD